MLDRRVLDIGRFKNWALGTTSGWHTYIGILTIWVGGWECGLTALKRLLLSSMLLYSSLL
jgi:hypothetical protein